MIRLYNVSKSYPGGIKALRDINLAIQKGDFVFVTGQSGAGKTTLLRLIYGTDRPTNGQVQWEGVPVDHNSVSMRAGFVFQDFKLISYLTVLENVLLPLEIHKRAYSITRDEIKKRGLECLRIVSLTERCDSYPTQLSAGECQKTAIARALVSRPKALLADEPTGNLDFKSSVEVLQILREINRLGATVVVATHSRYFIQKLPKETLSGGKEVSVLKSNGLDWLAETKNIYLENGALQAN